MPKSRRRKKQKKTLLYAAVSAVLLLVFALAAVRQGGREPSGTAALGMSGESGTVGTESGAGGAAVADGTSEIGGIARIFEKLFRQTPGAVSGENTDKGAGSDGGDVSASGEKDDGDDAGNGTGGDEEDAAGRSRVKARPVTPLKIVPAGDPGDNPPNQNGWTENFREKQIYSYVQVPDEIYDGDLKWSGDWGHITAAGREFIYWGCGICCLSNIFSTYRAQAIPPDIVFEYAVANTDYNPYSGVGAVSWGQLKKVCEGYGFTASLKQKPADYSAFQRDVRDALAVIVLVSKDNDAKFWWYTSGHYVNLWEYDAVSDSVFLSDPSGLFNRARVMLIDIYRALKTASDAQYLVVAGP